MRSQLKSISGSRQSFTATFSRFGKKKGWEGREVVTLLFNDIILDGKIVSDHIWFTMGKQFMVLGLRPGDRISFKATVQIYIKGYKGRREDVVAKPLEYDYKLSRPTNIVKEFDSTQSQPTLF